MATSLVTLAKVLAKSGVAAVVVCLGLTLGGHADASPGLNSQRPSTGPPLTSLITALFSDIEVGRSSPAPDVFFPEQPYEMMKRGLLPNPAADYLHRLWAFFQLDLAAYHRAFLGRTRSALVGAEVDAHLMQWIAPGNCENNVGYWHLPGVRLVVRRDGHIVSAAVFSLISWRGRWYVIHLGPNPRPRPVGTVAAFRVGRGVAGPGGGC